MYLDEIIVSPKDLMIYDGATDIAFLGTKKKTIIVTLQKMIYFDKNRQKETQHG